MASKLKINQVKNASILKAAAAAVVFGPNIHAKEIAKEFPWEARLQPQDGSERVPSHALFIQNVGFEHPDAQEIFDGCRVRGLGQFCTMDDITAALMANPTKTLEQVKFRYEDGSGIWEDMMGDRIRLSHLICLPNKQLLGIRA